MKREFGVTAATRREVIFKLGFDPVRLGFHEVSEPTSDDIVICNRAPGNHTADAHIERCSRCRHRIWVASTTIAAPQRVCMNCYVKETQ